MKHVLEIFKHRRNQLMFGLLFVFDVIFIGWMWAFGILLFQVGVLGIVISHYEKKRDALASLCARIDELIEEIKKMSEDSPERKEKLLELKHLLDELHRV